MGKRHFTFPAVFLFFVIATAAVFGDTWYVDPVNGSIDNTGTSPFKVPYSNEGPAKEIIQVTGQAGEYDIVVLMDGVYTGPQNTAPNLFSEIDWKHLYVVSAYGAENCKIILYAPITLDSIYYAELPTVFSGVTFTSAAYPYQSHIRTSGNSPVRFENCTFTEFQIGGCYPLIEISAVSVFENCTFKSNDTLKIIYCSRCSVTIENSVFTENKDNAENGCELAIVDGGYSSDIIIKNSSFTQNTSRSQYSAISCRDGDFLWVEGCVIKDNTTELDITANVAFNGIYFNNVGCVIIANTQVSNLSGRLIGMTGVYAEHPEIFHMYECQLNGNNSGLIMRAGPSSNVEISNCEFIDNHNLFGNLGGIQLSLEGSGAEIQIRDCDIQRNSAGIRESSMDGSGTVTISNCLITDNEFDGIASYLYGQVNQQVINCTIVNNSQGGDFANTTLKNCILRQWQRDVTIVNAINYCNIEGGWQWSGVGNIDVDPLFADGGTWHTDPSRRIPGTDYHLKSAAGRWDPAQEMYVLDDQHSPCIDAGDPADIPFFEPTGSGGRVNMGAYGNTWQASRSDICTGGYRNSGMLFADINRDCTVNLADYAVMAAQWLESTLVSIP